MMIEDVGRAVAFYRDVLGFEVVVTAPGPQAPAWALLKRAGVELLFESCASMAGVLPVPLPAVRALTIYMDLDDVESLYRRVVAQVPVVSPLREGGHGRREFTIHDCNGFLLTFAEALPAVRRAA